MEHYTKGDASPRLLSGQRGTSLVPLLLGSGAETEWLMDSQAPSSQQVVPGPTGLNSYTRRTWAGWPQGIAHSDGTQM